MVDLETTGLHHAQGDRVIEVAIIRLEGLNDSDPVRFTHLVNPSIPIPKQSQSIHGISDTMVASAPTFGTIAQEIRDLLEGAVFVAHHAPFDLGFLAAEFERTTLTLPEPVAVIDTLRIARTLFAFPSCALGSLADRMNLDLRNHHRALADANATLAALRCMLSELDRDRTGTMGEFLSYLTGMRKGGDERTTIKQKLRHAAESNMTIEIGYTDVQGPGSLITKRRVTVERLRSDNIEGWCHLRAERRVFKLERIHCVDA